MNEQIEYRGYTINIKTQFDPPNPWENGDCEPPVLVVSGRDQRSYGVDFELPDLTADDIRRNATEIARALGAETLLHAVARDYPERGAVEAINEQLAEHFTDQYEDDQLELIADVYRWKGIPAETFGRTGYTQGDYLSILVVLTPEWLKETGVPPEYYARQMELAADLYAAYAFGDVYGYTVEDSDSSTLDSCWGFYGDDYEESGLLEYARDAIDQEIEHRRKAKQAQVKTWIRNHVPLEYRGAV